LQCTTVAVELATALSGSSPFSPLPAELIRRLYPLVLSLTQLIHRFRAEMPTPEGTNEFENELSAILRDIGRVIVECVYNSAEPESRELLPTQLGVGDHYYQRCHKKSANRKVATLFGVITLWRFAYRSIGETLPCVFPLEISLGLEAARATPALADRIGQLTAQCTQQATLLVLLRDHGVQMSVHLLRTLAAATAAGMSEHCLDAQANKLLDLLKDAYKSRGKHRPVLSVGRDGTFVPIRKGRRKHRPEYREAAVGTLSVQDRAGKRVGSVYLGRMPEEGQPTLTSQLTKLITKVLEQWAEELPRLVYVTDGGNHQKQFFKKVLRKMRNPRSPGQRLKWDWVLDYFHACQYITKLAEALFGDTREGHAWAAKMRHLLKHKSNGIYRVLHSAAAIRERRQLVGLAETYDKAYGYLRRRIRHLNYQGCRKRGLPIGSGVTEACCKTMFTQRMKQSGMSWNIESGQTVVDLRAIHLSGIWEPVRKAYLQSKQAEAMRTQEQMNRFPDKKAA